MTDHLFKTTSDTGGQCGVCGELWEHRNHREEHRRVISPNDDCPVSHDWGEEMTDIYVGIDPGSKNCALVAWSPTRGLITTWKPKGTMPTGVLRLRKLMVEISNEFVKLAAVDPGGRIAGIAMEAYSMAEKYGQHASGEIGACIKMTILAHFDAQDPRAYPVLVAPQQLKKFATGNGNTRKDMLAKEVLKRWSVDFDDTNLAEAYVLARIAYAVDADPEMAQFQRDVVKALENRTEAPPGLNGAIQVTKRRLVRVGGRGVGRKRP